MTLSIVVPCYNERDGIPQLLDALRETRRLLAPAYECEWIFVDDGSNDGTAEALEAACADELCVQFLRHGRNRGLGAALRTGFAAARGELIATMDSDCTYDPRTLGPMLARLSDGDVVLASPYHPEGRVEHVPGYRLFLSRNLSRLYNQVVGAQLYTYTSLFRVYRREAVQDLPFASDGFVAMAEIVVEALRRGCRVVEHPARLTVRRSGSSKAVILRLIRDHAVYLWRLRRAPAPQQAAAEAPVEEVVR